MADLIDFLEARIAEDEADARRGLEMEGSAGPVVGWFNPGRVLSECAAKRVILGNVPLVTDVPSAIGTTSEYVLMSLAAVYKDHPDYQEGWTVDGL
ncbi:MULTISPECIES: DUF6221 family protein [unclassified Arthrobacter]|uniref:DUF6221 family protein n=1 Tax=unclassified Arthrobacter TaxID=235627 RepID=UPI001F47B83C|nr:DUF6221 family protein [Arthrobacter sp. FW305-BF8]UKA53581.1 DUF6221 family protein [Arthrobacter sp. FW305-BF8]